MEKRFLLTLFSAITLFCGQFIFLGCETESADDPEFSGSIDPENTSTNTTSSVSSNISSGNNSTSNNSTTANNNSSTDTFAWGPLPELLYKGESVTISVKNNVGTVNWSISPSDAAVVTYAETSSAIIKASDTTSATMLQVTATDQTTKKSLTANIPLV